MRQDPLKILTPWKKTFGYILLSSKDQNADRQLNEMLELGISKN